jgi:hypothetical protein
MDFYPDNILLEVIYLLDASSPPGLSQIGREGAERYLQDLSFIWWLEYFLRAEPTVFQEKFDSLPHPEQSNLASRIWRCFLHQPLIRRLLPSPSRPEKTLLWKVVRDGSLLQLTDENERPVTKGLYYIFPHRRLWPGMAAILREKITLAPEDLKSLQTAVEFTLQSRLSDIRRRAEGLRSFLTHPDPTLSRAGELPPAEPEPKIEVFKPKTAKRKKKSSGQLNLFD